jgi:hypothetical protein
MRTRAQSKKAIVYYSKKICASVNPLTLLNGDEALGGPLNLAAANHPHYDFTRMYLGYLV